MSADTDLAAAEWVVACKGRRQKLERLTPGLYRVHWTSGQSSLAAVGCGWNGDNWIAPTNWLRPSTIPALEANDWGDVERFEKIDRMEP